MTEQLQLTKKHRVLEIGRGSGYQTAFLVEFTPEGIMTIPVGEAGLQHLVMITKDRAGTVEEKKLLDGAFVPLEGKYS